MRGRLGVYLYAFAYHAMTVYGLMGFAAGWFNDSLLMGVISWFGLSMLGSLVWSVFNRGSVENSLWKTVRGVLLSLVVSLLPPFAYFIAGHSLVAWGFILQGWGFVGVAVALGLTVAMAAGLSKWRSTAIARSVCALVVTLLLIAGAVTPYQDFQTPQGIVGMDTYYGAPPQNDDQHVERFAAVKAQINDAVAPGGVAESAQVIVLPENTMNVDDPALDFMVRSEVLLPLSYAQKSAVVGKMAQTNDGYKNQAALLSDGVIGETVDQRQPAMLSMWRPWAKEHFPLDWTRDSALTLADGRVGRVLICYEEYIPAIFLIDELAGGHDMAIILSSNWSATTQRLPEVQRMHSLGMSKLFGREAVRAVNYPAHWQRQK